MRGAPAKPCPRCRAGQDHPRGCGEHGLAHWQEGSSWGSSPRMRGAQNGNVVNQPSDRIIPADAGSTDNKSTTLISGRIIPADAGSTAARDCRRSRDKDHPRGCGEHGLPCLSYACALGSSPRMRGALNILGRFIAHAGIIPADAGSTCSNQSW